MRYGALDGSSLVIRNRLTSCSGGAETSLSKVAGVQLTVVQTCNVSGNWVDYRCLGAGDLAPPNTPPQFTNVPENGVLCVAEGANMPSTIEAAKAFEAAGVLYAPGKASNAGGVATSALEMEQNAGRTRWDFATAEAKLTGIMADIHDSCVAAAEEYGRPGDYVLGANAAGFTRVADVMIAHGIV